MFYKKILIILLIFFTHFQLKSQNICFVMNSYIRPYKNIIDNFNFTTKYKISYIIKKENFWKVKNCDNIFVFGEDSINEVRKNYYDKEKKFIYLFAIYRNFIDNLKENESLYYLQLDGDLIFSKVKKIIPGANNWLVFYSGERQRKYIQDSIKFCAYYDIDIIPVFAGKDVNLNNYIESKDYDLFWFIPDSLYSTPYIVNFIIEKLIYLKKFSIGFNEFFIKSGTTISFKINYKKTADKILKNMKDKKFGAFPFEHEVLINKKNLRYLLNEIKQKN